MQWEESQVKPGEQEQGMIPGQKERGQERVCLDHRGKVFGTRMGSAPQKIRWGAAVGEEHRRSRDSALLHRRALGG